MSTLLQVDRVKYRCSCGEWVPLCRLYFCRHCTVLRCRDCVTHEVDSIFCSNCLENMPTAEARVKKNRCANCSECPCCGNTLAFRATSLLPHSATATSPQTEKAPATPGAKKVYYLACNLCRWTTRDAELTDQPQASSWPEPQNENEKMLTAVLDHFRQLAAIEKSDRERKKFTKRRFHGGIFADKYGLHALMTRRRLGLGLNEKEASIGEEVRVEAEEEVEPLPDHIFTQPLLPDSITSPQQRVRQPLNQPEIVSEMLPLKKPLCVRRSLRCKQCDHNLCKGEYNPSSVKFKIQLFAIFHIPELRIAKEPQLVANKECTVELTLSNLTQAMVHIVLLPNIELEESSPDFVKATIPLTELTIPMRDETAELDDSADHSDQFQDDPNVVTFRRKHKLGIRLPVTVPSEQTGHAKMSCFGRRKERRPQKKKEIMDNSGWMGELPPELQTAPINYLAIPDQNPKEVVLLDFNHFYNFTTESHVKLSKLIESTFSDRLFPQVKDASKVTLQSLWEQKRNIICFYQNTLPSPTSLLWTAEGIISPWPNKDSIKAVINFLTNALSEREKNSPRFFVVQGIATPRTQDILKHAVGSLKCDLAGPMTAAVTQWARESQDFLKPRVNIFMADFVHQNDFCDTVIRINTKQIINLPPQCEFDLD